LCDKGSLFVDVYLDLVMPAMFGRLVWCTLFYLVLKQELSTRLTLPPQNGSA
jgi:hypothetical protein